MTKNCAVSSAHNPVKNHGLYNSANGVNKECVCDIINTNEYDVIDVSNTAEDKKPEVMNENRQEDHYGYYRYDYDVNVYTKPRVCAANSHVIPDDFIEGSCEKHDVLDESLRDYLHHAEKYRNLNPRNCIIGHLNINSIRNKFDAIECMLVDNFIDIFAISETKLDDSFPMSQFSVTDFSTYRKDRNIHGGGLMLYMRSSIPHRRRIDLEPEYVSCFGSEIMVIEAQLYKKEKWFIAVIYKPPKVNDKNFERFFSDLCNKLQRESSHWFVMGDINYDMNSENILGDLCVMYNLSNLVVGPTCFKSQNPSAVDVLLSSEPKRFKCSLNTPCSISDFHNFTCVATKLHKCHTLPKTIFYRSYKTFDEENFINDIKNIPFSICDIFDDEDDRLWSFSKLLSGVIDRNAPIKKKIIKKPSVPYMNSRLRKAMYRKNMLRNAYRKGKVKWDDYRRQRNLTTAIYKQSKLNYFRERCDGGPKSQSFWKTIKPFMTDKSTSHTNQIILQEDGKIINNPNEICEIFNTYFTSVANNIGFDDSIPPDFYTEEGFSAMIDRHRLHPSIIKIKENVSSDLKFTFKCVNYPDIVNVIKGFDGKKAQGYDMMPMKLLQKCAPHIAPQLAKLVNNSITENIFPNDLKFAEVSSLFKKKDPLSKINYRPVSVLIALSKIYEKVVSTQLSDFFTEIFSSLLSAFRKDYSCQSTLLNMIEKFKCSLDRGDYVACISMDISKAFDCLPHCLTVCKLHAYGLSRDACTLIASYLCKRKQRVKIGNVRSCWKETNKGVPQGSILGPLIFNIFMNDIFYFVKHADLFNYADDNSVSISGKELSLVSKLLQSEAEVTVRWFSDNAMEANPNKFQGILFKGNKEVKDFDVSVDGQSVEFSKSMTSLGICIDNNLTFDKHINDICIKASRQISALQRLTGSLDYPSRKAIYNSFIFSHFNYCPLVWFFTSRASIVKMQKVQERALRFVLKDSVSDYESLLSKTGFDSFRISSIKNMAIEIYKILNGMGPKYLAPFFSKSNIPYDLRDNNKVIQPLKRTTTFGIKSFVYFGAHLWNLLPLDVKDAMSLSNFKSLIKKWSGPTCSCCVCTLII